MRAFFFSTGGKIAGAIFLAICGYVGFGPDQWIATMTGLSAADLTLLILRAAFLFAGVIVLAAWTWPTLRNPDYIFWHKVQLISLEHACQKVLSRTSQTTAVKLWSRLDHSGILGQIAHHLIGANQITMFGAFQPSSDIIKIPAEDAGQFMFSSDATELYDQWSPDRKYGPIFIKRSDFRRRLKQLIQELQ